MNKLLPLLLALLAIGCEVLEEDISGTQVRITAPSDRVSVAAGSVDFRWAAAQYAVGYEFTVVEPLVCCRRAHRGRYGDLCRFALP